MARPRDNAKQEWLLDAALTEIANAGLVDLSIDATARRAKLAPSTIYIYFKSKDALIEKLYAEVKTRLSTIMAETGDLPVRPGVERVCANYLEFCRSCPRELVFLQQIEASPAWKTRTRPIAVRAMRPLVSLLARGQAERIIKNVDSEFLIAFLSTTLQMAAGILVHAPAEQPRNQNSTIIAMCWDGIAA